jgi:phenylacetate-coenzyme A ligase PaaK-like adenylate-forming protein
MNRWTSGTSGQPTVCFWTDADWAALVNMTTRMLARQAPPGSLTVFNGYSEAHFTGPFHHSTSRQMGATVFDRSHYAEDSFATRDQAALFGFNTLVMPGPSVKGNAWGWSIFWRQSPTFWPKTGCFGGWGPAAPSSRR